MKSPDGKHIAELIYKSEIRFGPAYYSLKVDGTKIKRRTFGHKIKWSDDSRYIATVEWLTTDYQKGPITRVAIIDVKLKKLSEFKMIKKGFAKDFCFNGANLVYKKHFYDKGIIKEVEVEIASIDNWKKIGL